MSILLFVLLVMKQLFFGKTALTMVYTIFFLPQQKQKDFDFFLKPENTFHLFPKDGKIRIKYRMFLYLQLSCNPCVPRLPCFHFLKLTVDNHQGIAHGTSIPTEG